MGSIIFERKDLTARVADDERVTDENSNSDAEFVVLPPVSAMTKRTIAESI